MRFITPEDSCTGCSLCSFVCPKQCIRMVEDKEGFLRPSINNTLCVECDLCRLKCPVNNIIQNADVIPEAFAARTKDLDLLLGSSSGGVFFELAKSVIERKGVVFGAAFSADMEVVHKACYTLEQLKKLQGSKYVQSRIDNTFFEAKKELENGKLVYFSGTPCQIAGLHMFLDKEYNSLITQDLICHGVPSPKVLKKYIHSQEEKYNSKICGIDFRSKINGYSVSSIVNSFANEERYVSYAKNDYYMRCFLTNMCLRPSCYSCHFKTNKRFADITLGDFWGFDYRIRPKWNDDKGVSLVLIHSEKGQDMFKKVSSIEKIKTDYLTSIERNPSMVCSSEKGIFRKQFFNGLDKYGFDKVCKKYCCDTFKVRIKRKAYKLWELIKNEK